MGAHKQHKGDKSPRNFHLPAKWPPLPSNIGKIRKIRAIDGRMRHFRIDDEIIHPQSDSDRKIIAFQKMMFLEEDRVEYRFGYYMIGLKPKARGRWVWGQFCLLIPQQDLMFLLEEAKRRKWFK
jgi:hypothetical protein